MESSYIQVDKVKDVLITRTAIKLLKSESLVEKVIGFQFKDVTQMVKVHHQIEISGFGKFMISGAKLRRRIEKLEGVKKGYEGLILKELPEKQKSYYEKKLGDVTNLLEYLKTRRNGYEN